MPPPIQAIGLYPVNRHSRESTGFKRVLLGAAAVIFHLFLLPALSQATKGLQWGKMEWGGHVKARTAVSWHDDNSLYRRVGTREYYDGSGELRLKNQWFISDNVYMEAHYEALVSGGETRSKTAEIRERLPGAVDFLSQAGICDDRRLFDLSRTLEQSDSALCYHRLDRLYLKYLPDWGSIAAGRQALTWGNGLLFHPMDLFNPFSPTRVQRDYKMGDDMALVQVYAGDLGDFQLLYAPRRDRESGELRWDASSVAVKCHGMKNGLEFDILAAKHYSDTVVGAGVSGYFKGATWRTDAVYTVLDDPDGKNGFLTATANMDYSWTWAGKNLYGLVEFYYNGLGESDAGRAMRKPALMERLERGELFTLGKTYLAAQIQAELHPLLNIFGTVIHNLGDCSAIIQPKASWDALQNLELIAGADLYFGESGSEFGGIPLPGTRYIHKPAHQLFVWMSWYF